MRCLLIIVILFNYYVYSQTLDSHTSNLNFNIPEVAMLSIKPSNETVFLNLTNVTEAGENSQVVSTNNNKWINFTSCLNVSTSYRNISAQIVTGTTPSGTELKMTVANYSGSGAGNYGIPISNITLSNSPQNIITNIGGAYTGNGEYNGYQITYNLSITNYELLDYNDSNSLTISFTLIDN